MSILKSYFLVEFELKLLKILGKLLIFKPKAYLWVSGQNKKIMVFSELIDNAI
jgi:hypothetical protein